MRRPFDSRESLLRWLESEGARKLAWLVLAIYLAGLGVSAVFRTQGDFRVYYRAGERVMRGEEIYPAAEKDRFIYPPAVAIGFAPFAALPKLAAKFAWWLVNAAALIAFLYGGAVMLFGRATPLSAPLVVAPMLLTFRFVGNNFHHGQINLLVLAAIVWGIVCARENRAVRAGAMLGAAILLKPFALLGALYLVIERRWRALAWSALAIGVLLMLPIAVFGPERWASETAAYRAAVISMTERYRTMKTNQSAVAAVTRLAGGESSAPLDGLALIAMAFEAALVAAVVLWIIRARREQATSPWPARFAVASLFCLIPSITPISWKSYYAALLVPYMALTMAVWQDSPRGVRGSRALWALVALSWLVNLAPTGWINRWALFYSAHLVSSLLVLAALYVASRYASTGAGAGDESDTRVGGRAPSQEARTATT